MAARAHPAPSAAIRRREGPGAAGGVPGHPGGLEAPSGSVSRRSLQHGGACRGLGHSCSAARTSRGRLRPLPALPGAGYRNPGHSPGWGGRGGAPNPRVGSVTFLPFPIPGSCSEHPERFRKEEMDSRDLPP